MPMQRLSFALLSVTLWLLAPAAGRSADAVSYERDVQPILQKYCLGCHTEFDPGGGFVMESHAGLLEGSDTGVVITPGEPASSRLMLMVRGQLDPLMPPEGEPRPGDEEISILAKWIEAGAAGPEGGSPMKTELRVPSIKPAESADRPITGVAVSPDGHLRATARFGVVEIRSAEGDEVAVIGKQPGKVNALSFSRDGKRVLVASGLTGAYGRAAIYYAETGELQREMVGHRDTLYAARFSPDETIVATAGYDRDIILWDVETAKPIRTLSGHNGAIFDLAFSPDGKTLVSGCADETAKVWQVATGERLDTLSQPEGEVFVVKVTDDGRYILAGSSDNRLRVWRLVSGDAARINPIVATRFVDESPLVDFALTPDGKALVVVSEAGNLKVLSTGDWRQRAVLKPLSDAASDLAVSHDGRTCFVSLMNGSLQSRTLPSSGDGAADTAAGLEPVYLKLDEPARLEESTLRESHAADAEALPIPRGAVVGGTIAERGEADAYEWTAAAGEVWAIDADATDGSQLDPIVTVRDDDGRPVLRTRLQAVRDSYFTFRGKNSTQSNDFRMFAWQEMHLDDYLYAAGEVTRLWMHPRGPDSGFNVYPGKGTRWTYFGTTHATHALGEPAYIVRPLARGEEPLANGLPVFDIPYQNDDDPMRRAGKNSRLVFTAPADGRFTLEIADTRDAGGSDYNYRLTLRAAEPDFRPSVTPISKPIRKGTGREFEVRVERIDGYDGPVAFELSGLPDGLVSNAPVVVEEGQRFATGTIWADPGISDWGDKSFEPKLTATATILGRKVERDAGSAGKLTVAGPPQATPKIRPRDGSVVAHEPWTLTVKRGETVSAEIILRRQEGFNREVSFGKEYSGRNATHGLYVDNIGLNGLLVRENESRREFFLTADPVATPGKRSFFLTSAVDGGVTSYPITVEVLP